MKRSPRFLARLLIAVLPILMATPGRSEEVDADDKFHGLYMKAFNASKAQKLEEAEAGYRQALAEADKGKIVDYRLARCLDGLTITLIRREKFAEAKKTVSRLVAAAEKNKDPEVPLLERGLEYCVWIGMQVGDPDLAERSARRLVEIYEKGDRRKDLKYTGYLFMLAMLHQDREDPAKAEPLMKRAIALEEAKPAGSKALIPMLEAYEDLLKETKRAPEAAAIRARIDRLNQDKVKK